MYEFAYNRPTSLEEAVKALAADADAKPLAGGMTLLPTIKQRLAKPSALFDLSGIASLAYIKRAGDGLEIGAMTRHVDVARSADVQQVIPALAQLAGGIGDPQVRNRGTMGGSVANSDPAADYPAGVLGLGATIVTNKREIKADDFFTGLFSTALAEGELITAIRFPKPEKAHYKKFPNPASRYAIVGVFVAKFASGARVAVTGAGPCVFRVPEMEKALTASFTPAAVKDIKVSDKDLNKDLHASPEYRAHLVTVMARRAVEAMV
jgi:aerobic carbon-monoxide dehydrogenase medium subunit